MCVSARTDSRGKERELIVLTGALIRLKYINIKERSFYPLLYKKNDWEGTNIKQILSKDEKKSKIRRKKTLQIVFVLLCHEITHTLFTGSRILEDDVKKLYNITFSKTDPIKQI